MIPNCRELVAAFADALKTGQFSGGTFLLSRERNTCDIYQGHVLLGDETYVYKVSKVNDSVLPEQVAKAIQSGQANITRCVQKGRRFDATLWHDDLCYMLWHRRKAPP